ncbi:MAG: bifunctional serine/threonine-protein kinase/formylglycine-generating enzyme family protein [Anaerolineales bacterium]|nr:bifunctional serine/threonine-protein kinase/formylglycine-generating enzyme family protein [Anaerolineales bacterium]
MAEPGKDRLQPGDLLVDKYRIERELDRGAYGIVWLATQMKVDRKVAIKELRLGEGGVDTQKFGKYEERFRREARLLALFNHNKIVQCIELVEPQPGVLYLVMEYVDGGNLQKYLNEKQRLSSREACKLMIQILEALQVVHDHQIGIIHRDIKPSNILLTRDKQVKLADFGIAQVGDESMRNLDGQITQEGKPHPGSPDYMSPEQKSTARCLYPTSDVYSAGCVLFEMLTGVSYSKARRDGKTLHQLRPSLPEWLSQAVEGALRREIAVEGMEADQPDKRTRTAKEFRQQLLRGMKAEREAKEAAQKAREEVERENLERENRERREKAAREAQEKAERERLEHENRERKERESREKAAQEAKQKAAREAQEKAAREAAEKARLEAEEQKRKELILELASGVTMELVRVPAGEFLMGSDTTKDKDAEDDETPQHKLYLPEYLIGKYPVTVAQYAAFVKATGHKSQAHSDVQKKGNHPVTMVSWDDALAFCQWASKQTVRNVRLPSEAEWEKAARGTDGRIWPWGDQEPDEMRCNFGMNVKDTTPVGKYSPLGDSPYGCVDMSGNVWEWTSSLYKLYPYNPQDGREDTKVSETRVLRGGSFYYARGDARCAFRGWRGPNLWSGYGGFRVGVVSPI